MGRGREGGRKERMSSRSAIYKPLILSHNSLVTLISLIIRIINFDSCLKWHLSDVYAKSVTVLFVIGKYSARVEPVSVCLGSGSLTDPNTCRFSGPVQRAVAFSQNPQASFLCFDR